MFQMSIRGGAGGEWGSGGRECDVVLGIPNLLSEQLHSENNPRSQEKPIQGKSTALADVPSASLRSSSPLHNLVKQH